MVRLNWNADSMRDALRRKIARGLTRAALIVEKAAITKVNIGQPVRRTKGGHTVGLNPSKPGEPPHVLLGRLKQSITHSDVEEHEDKLTIKVGTNVIYGQRLERGFVGTDAKGRNVNQAPRPYLRPSLDENQTEVGEAIAKG